MYLRRVGESAKKRETLKERERESSRSSPQLFKNGNGAKLVYIFIESVSRDVPG